MKLPKFVFLALLLLIPLTASAQDQQEEGAAIDYTRDTLSQPGDMISRLEALAREGRLPDYEDLRLPEENAIPIESFYIRSMPLMRDDSFTTGVVFAEVPEDARYARMTLDGLVEVALANNFDLINSDRNVLIALSDVRGAEAFFIPFVDVVSSVRASRTVERDAADLSDFDGEERAETTTLSGSAGLEATQNLYTGGALTLDAGEGFSNSRTDRSNSGVTFDDDTYDADVQARFIQPLLRGSGLLTGDGTDIGTADLRASRLSQMDTILSNSITRRNVVFNVIAQYFEILQLHQQLRVSRDAILERERFLTETRVKYNLGRVAESEILRAQIQFLSEVETAINRIQGLDEAREDLLLLLGLPLDTPISLLDITEELATRGQLELPAINEAVQLALNNREELMRADINTRLSEISEQLARNDTLPDLDFDAGYRRFDSDSDFYNANDFDRDTIDGGLTLRIPLQNIQRREAYRRASLRVEQRETDRLSLERDLRQEVLSAHRNVLTTEARLTVLRKRVEQARRNLELINGSFEVGFASITEVRLAQDDLFDAETAYSNAVLNYQISIARLYVAMGQPLI